MGKRLLGPEPGKTSLRFASVLGTGHNSGDDGDIGKFFLRKSFLTPVPVEIKYMAT